MILIVLSCAMVWKTEQLLPCFAFPKAMAACGLLHNMSVDAAIRSHVAPGLQLELEPK